MPSRREKEKPAGGANEPITVIPARVVDIRVVIHTRLTNALCRMRPTITSNTHKGPDVNIINGDEIVVKFS
jgi:hypothetical protein